MYFISTDNMIFPFQTEKNAFSERLKKCFLRETDEDFGYFYFFL